MNKKRVKVGKYKTVFKGKIFEVQQAEAVYSRGKKAVFERAIRPSTVVILALNDKKEVLLTWEYRLASKKYMWFLPAGRVDKEKDPKKAAMRELQEETGFKAAKMKLLFTQNSGNVMQHKWYFYVAEGLTPAPLEADEDEDITVKPMSIKKAMDLVINGEIENANIAMGIIRLHKYLKTK
jgi:ADP-ribose pyrophosphatase